MAELYVVRKTAESMRGSYGTIDTFPMPHGLAQAFAEQEKERLAQRRTSVDVSVTVVKVSDGK